jgi:NAD(P)-dependent dehydrogenase (short-subunit alcohol dehydrogenase family)
MSSKQNKVLVVVAAGPLIGITTAAVFATKGFTHIALIARNASKLNTLTEVISKSTITKTYSADVAEPDNLMATLNQIKADFGVPEVVLYNGAVISGGTFGEQTEDEILNELKVCVFSIQTEVRSDLPFKGLNSRAIYDCKVGDAPSPNCIFDIQTHISGHRRWYLEGSKSCTDIIIT